MRRTLVVVLLVVFHVGCHGEPNDGGGPCPDEKVAVGSWCFGQLSPQGTGVVLVVADGGCSLDDAGTCAGCVQAACCAVAAACSLDGSAGGECAVLVQCVSESCAVLCPGVP